VRRSAAKLLTKDEAQPRMKLVTTYLVVRKGQIPCKRYCKLGHLTPYSRHQQPQRWGCDNGAWLQPMPGRRCREQWRRQAQMLSC